MYLFFYGGERNPDDIRRLKMEPLTPTIKTQFEMFDNFSWLKNSCLLSA